jgi:photosystem II stability/assembly factor-like uncharacterized protein
MQRQERSSCPSFPNPNAMRTFIGLLLLITIASACRKNQHNNNTGKLNCLDTTINNTTIPEGLWSVYFIDGKNGFAGGYYGGIYKTTDSARTWTKLNSGVNFPIYGIYFTDAMKGFAVGGKNSCDGTGCIVPGGFILRTLDGGNTWTIVHTPSIKREISAVYFINALLGFCVGDNIIYKTTDGGNTWNEYIINNIEGKLMDIRFEDTQTGYAVSLFDKVFKTTDGGNTWTRIRPQNNQLGYYSLSVQGKTVFVSSMGKIIKSTNGGTTWHVLPDSPSDIFAIHFIDKSHGFAFGRGDYSGGDFGYHYGSIYCTSNGGLTWNGTSSVKSTSLIKAVHFPTRDIGYAVSGNRVIKIAAK